MVLTKGMGNSFLGDEEDETSILFCVFNLYLFIYFSGERFVPSFMHTQA